MEETKEEDNITLNDLVIEEVVEENPVEIPDTKEINKKLYKCTLTGHEANTKSAIYKHRNYLKKNGTLPDGRGKIMYIGQGEEKPKIVLGPGTPTVSIPIVSASSSSISPSIWYGSTSRTGRFSSP